MAQTWNQAIHFALNKYLYSKNNCYQIEISKDVLIELYKNSQLRINTYEFSEIDPSIGMTIDAYGPFGFPIEFVIFGMEGAKRLSPLMQKAQLISEDCDELLSRKKYSMTLH